MATIANLAVNVISNTGSFNKGMSQTRKTLANTNKDVGGFGNKLKGLAGPIAAAVGGLLAFGKVVSGVSQAFEKMDEAAKKALSLNIGAQQLMGLQHAAELAGMSASQLTSNMQKMQKGIGEALTGVGTAKEAFNRLGIDIEHLATLTPEQQLAKIAEAIKSIENPAERAAAATQIFGRAGMDMLPMLEGGAAAIEGSTAALQELQGTLDQQDFSAIEATNDAWTRFKTAAEGVWNQLAVALAPVLELIANVLTEIVSAIARAIDGFNDFFGVADRYIDTKKKIAQASEAELATAEKARKAEEEAAKAREALEKRGIQLAESLRTPIEKYTDTIADLDMLLSEGVISWETYERAVKKANDELEKSEEFKKREIKAIERQAVGIVTRGSTAALSAQQKQVRVLERLAEQNRLELEESRKRNAKLEAIRKNTGSANIVRI